MAVPIHCDAQGDYDTLADVMVTRFDGGQTVALCNDHFLDFAWGLIVLALGEAIPGVALPASYVELLAATAESERTADETLDRLAGTHPASLVQGEPGRDDDEPPHVETDPRPGDPLGVEHVEHRGQSRSRRAYEARKRAKAAEVVSEPTSEVDARPGGSTAVLDDPDTVVDESDESP